MLSRLEMRNRDIFEAFRDGRTVEELAQLHGLSSTTIRQIVDREKLNRAISPMAYYRALRLSEAVTQAQGGRNSVT